MVNRMNILIMFILSINNFSKNCHFHFQQIANQGTNSRVDWKEFNYKQTIKISLATKFQQHHHNLLQLFDKSYMHRLFSHQGCIIDLELLIALKAIPRMCVKFRD